MNTQLSRFVILFTGRSGSSYLASMLNSHQNILCEGEMLAQIISSGEQPGKQIEWSRRFFESARSNDVLAVGYKTKVDDVVDTKGFAGILTTMDVKIIHLTRENLVKQVVSAINAKRLHEKTGQWNVRDEGDRLGALAVDPAQFDRVLRNRINGESRLAAFVAELQLPTLRVLYEDLLAAREETIRGICTFLGVPYEHVVSEFKKHTPDDLRTVISNFDELKMGYAGTPFESMFESD